MRAKNHKNNILKNVCKWITNVKSWVPYEKLRGPTKWFHWYGFFLLTFAHTSPKFMIGTIFSLIYENLNVLIWRNTKFHFLSYWNLTAFSVQSHPLKVTAILNETSFGIFKNELTEITKNMIVEIRSLNWNVFGPGYWINLFSKQLSRWI